MKEARNWRQRQADHNSPVSSSKPVANNPKHLNRLNPIPWLHNCDILHVLGSKSCAQAVPNATLADAWDAFDALEACKNEEFSVVEPVCGSNFVKPCNVRSAYLYLFLSTSYSTVMRARAR